MDRRAARGPARRGGVAGDAVEVLFTGLDRGVEGGVEQAYQRSLTLAEAGDGPLLAYAINGEPLPPQHGFPLRLVVPGWYGMTSVKWLARIDAIAEPFDGYQQATGYRIRAHEDDPGTPVTRIMPRALMVPPGIPDFMTRGRFVRPGPCELTGRAWSGWGAIEAVEVSADGGASWAEAELGPERSRAPGGVGVRVGRRAPASTSCAAARATPPATRSPSTRTGTSAATRTRRSSACRSPSR